MARWFLLAQLGRSRSAHVKVSKVSGSAAGGGLHCKVRASVVSAWGSIKKADVALIADNESKVVG